MFQKKRRIVTDAPLFFLGYRKLGLMAVFLLSSLPICSQTIHVKLTYYHPTVNECGNSPLITADGSRIDLKKLKDGKIRWCAISRDLLPLFPPGKPKRIWIEGYGVYEVHDVTGKRIRRTVDILLHPTDKQVIYHKQIKIKILKNE